MRCKNIIKFLILILCVNYAYSWDSEELEIFDLVEELKDNFYTMMGIQQDATLQEVKKAFRNLSIILHPDKNDAEDADIQFRNLVSVYEVLKDPGKREKYNNVLKNGLPNWKSALYYYRHVRKMGLLEMSIILFVIITIGQYFVSWAAYLEKKYTAEQIIGSKLKRLQKKAKTSIDIEEILKEIPPPSIKNTLPFQIPLAIWNIPSFIKQMFGLYSEYKEAKLEEKRREMEEDEKMRLLEEEMAKLKEAKSTRKRKPIFVAPEKTEEELLSYSKKVERPDIIQNLGSAKAMVTGGIWTDEDLTDLAKLIKKYPGGTIDRWEIIADALYRNVTEVTHMAAKLKENGYRIGNPTESVAENIAIKKNEKTKKSDQILVPESTWSQEQQQALEAAIVTYPKTSATDRWQKISNSVPGKTKEECLLRYKYLVELVKLQRKQAQEKEEEVNKNKTDDDKLEDYVEEDDKTQILKSKKKKSNEKAELENDNESVIKGKKRNLRKLRKKNMDFSTDEDSESGNENGAVIYD